ncbi:MAG: hypothetical protein IKX35_07100 [Bacteroidales bacterium]|nr:hypothetical protein [Bacteroidales bacterium]
MRNKIIITFVFLCCCCFIQAQPKPKTQQGNLLRKIPVVTSSEDTFERKSSSDNNQRLRLQSKPVKVDFDDTNTNKEIYKKQQNLSNSSTMLKGIEIMEDYVLFRDVVRRYTWLEGLGEPISQEEANHLPYYYRLSMKNGAGHYQLVEALHGMLLTSSHPISTYILDKENDTGEKNEEWRKDLSTIGQWLFYSDLSGENVVEERAYEAKEKNAKLIYSMQPVRNDSSHVTIAYTDSYGYPADMNEDYRFTYGSVVYITYDKQGFDSIIDYLDGEGYRKPNTNGVDQTRNVYDDKGRLLLITSNNCVGDYAIDNWGNCGIKYSYNDKMNTYSKICVDKDLNPMRMPPIRAGIEDTYIRCDIKKDQWGREIEAIMLTAEGEKDATMAGIHRITYSYTNDGRLQKKSYYDINGNPMIIK